MCTFYSATNTGIPTLNSKILIFKFNYSIFTFEFLNYILLYFTGKHIIFFKFEFLIDFLIYMQTLAYMYSTITIHLFSELRKH